MIQKIKNEFLIRFNHKFYSEASLDSTVDKFKEFCSISKKAEEGCFVVQFSSDDMEIPLEFSNYAFALNNIARIKND